jgi:hypothetical protein
VINQTYKQINKARFYAIDEYEASIFSLYCFATKTLLIVVFQYGFCHLFCPKFFKSGEVSESGTTSSDSMFAFQN